MKRSAFVAKLNDSEDPWVTSVVEPAEAAGVKWDPEEKPLPERLVVYSIGEGKARPMVEREGHRQLVREMTQNEATEAVRRWNVWLELRAEVVKVRPLAATPAAMDRLLAILDGKP